MNGKYPDADRDFSYAPCFLFIGGEVEFDTNWIDNPNDNYGFG
jgi:hypothetical protein